MVVSVERAEVGIVVLYRPEFDGQVCRARREESALGVPGNVVDGLCVAFEGSFKVAGFVVL